MANNYDAIINGVDYRYRMKIGMPTRKQLKCGKEKKNSKWKKIRSRIKPVTFCYWLYFCKIFG